MNADFFLRNNMYRASFAWILIATLIIGTSALAAGETLDPTFGSGGVVVTDLGGSSDTGLNIVLQPDGKIVMAASGRDGTVRVYLLKIEELIALAKSRVTRSLTTEECQKYLHMEQCPSEN